MLVEKRTNRKPKRIRSELPTRPGGVFGVQMAEHLPTSISALFPDGGLRQTELFAEIEAAIHAVLASGDLLGKMTPNPITDFNSRRSYERRPAQRGHPDGRGGVPIHAARVSGDLFAPTMVTCPPGFQSAPLLRAAAFLCRCPSPRPPLHFNSRCLQERQF